MCLIASMTLLSSCDEVIFDGEGDCSQKVQFVFKKHRQALHAVEGRENDAFYSSVECVHLFVINEETGEVVFDKIEKTENLHSAADLKIGSGSDKCYMPIDLQPGKYKFVAWCGLDDNDHNNAFSLLEDSRASYKECKVKTDDSTGHPVNHEKYQNLYHGVTRSVEITDDNGANLIIPIELTKNTNEISVWVQHVSASFSEGDYSVVYADSNGTMDFNDNSITDDSKLEYHPHTISILSSDTEYNGAHVDAGALIAHISTARLMMSNRDDARLEVRNKDGQTVFSIPLIKYLLEMQTFTDNGQYYLDCEDTYNCCFYLTGNQGTWTPTQIIINNWVRVPDQTGSL